MSNGLSTEKKGGNNIYLKIMNGKLVQTVKEGTPNAIERLNKNNEKVFELHYTGLTAMIKNIAIVEGKFGKELEVKASTENQNFVVQTPASGGYAFGIFSRMVNLDFDKETEIRPYAIENKEKGKTNHVTVLYQKQGDKNVKIESAFSKEVPNGLPELEKLKDPKNPSKDLIVKGKEVWDDSARIEFFSDVIYGEGGINEELIKRFGTPEQVAANEDKSDFLEETEAPIVTSGDSNALDFDSEADKQKEAAITSHNASQIAASDENAVLEGAKNATKAAAKKAAVKKAVKK